MAKFRIVRRNPVPQAGPRHLACGAAILAAAAGLVVAAGGSDPLVPDKLLRTIEGTLSVENALRETAAIASRARYPDSQGFFDAAEDVAARARQYGLENVHVERFRAAKPMWDAVTAELTVTSADGRRVPAVPAQYSADGDITGELVENTSGDLTGKVLLTDREPQLVWKEVGEHPPAAVISAAAGDFFGRRTPPEAIFWTEAPPDAVALMISPRDGEQLRALHTQGPVTVHVQAKAKRVTPGTIGMVMGEIPGTRNGPAVVLAAHLDHQFPGANDNGSGSGTLLELARTVKQLAAAGKLPNPRRTLRFWWSTEIEAERAYFQEHPEKVRDTLAAVVLDQAGGERGAENNLVVINSADWTPSYTDDLIENLVEYVKARYAPAEHEPDSLVTADGGGRQSLHVDYWDYQELTDNIAFASHGVEIPVIALAVPSLRVIHTNLDTVDKLDPTWMKRSALFTLASALYLAHAGSKEAQAILEYTFRRSVARLALSDDPVRDLPQEVKRLDSVRSLDPMLNTAPYHRRLEGVVRAMRAPQ